MITFKKLLMVSGLFFAFQFSFAQEKLEQRAAEMVKEMNAKLTDATKLTADQEKQMVLLYVEKIKEVRVVKKEITDETAQKEKVSEINKAYGKKIHETILTKEQKEALKEYRKNHKE